MGVPRQENRPNKIIGGTENERINLQVIRRTAAVSECADGVETIGNLTVPSSYELMHEKGFPVLRVGNRLVVPKEKFRQWVEEQITG